MRSAWHVSTDLHQPRGAGGIEVQAFALGHRDRAGVGPADHDHRHADPVEPGHIGDARDAHPRLERCKVLDGRARRHQAMRAAAISFGGPGWRRAGHWTSNPGPADRAVTATDPSPSCNRRLQSCPERTSCSVWGAARPGQDQSPSPRRRNAARSPFTIPPSPARGEDCPSGTVTNRREWACDDQLASRREWLTSPLKSSWIRSIRPSNRHSPWS